jgi:hypothetical protein
MLGDPVGQVGANQDPDGRADQQRNPKDKGDA